MRNSDNLKILGVIALILVTVGVMIYAIKAHNEWKDSCVAQGGHVIDQHTNSTIWISDSNGGHWGSSDSTTYYCYSQDGKLIDIE